MPATLHVATTGSDHADGSEERPFRTINRAAALAQPGDTVVVHAGEYREWVQPPRGGLSDRRRITYTAAPGEHVVIKGSEPVTGWERVDGDVWTRHRPEQPVRHLQPVRRGDRRRLDRLPRPVHAEEAPRRGLSQRHQLLRGLDSAPRCRTRRCAPRRSTTGPAPPTRSATPSRPSSSGTPRSATDHTTIWANFQGADPNAELVEINVRRSVFYPIEHHLDYITVRGFELAHAATPWAPPTADQPGLIGPNWAKGWIIEDNVIHDAKCSAISIGKEISTGHNFATVRGDKPGYQYQLESVFAARRDRLGPRARRLPHHPPQHHLRLRPERHRRSPRLRVLHHRGQPHLQHRDQARVLRLRDRRHQAARRPRRDHPAQPHPRLLARAPGWTGRPRAPGCRGTSTTTTTATCSSRSATGRTSSTTTSSHRRPRWSCSARAAPSSTTSSAARSGSQPVLERPTPYHVPHSTQVAGYAAIHGGDDRHIGNIFLGGDAAQAYGPTARAEQRADHGTVGYNGHPASMEDYLALVGDPTRGDHERFMDVKQPVYIRDNVYAAGAKPYEAEKGAIVLTTTTSPPRSSTTATRSTSRHSCPTAFDNARLDVTIGGADLPPVRFVDADFEEPDGTPAVLATDLVGVDKTAVQLLPGRPLACARLQDRAARADVARPSLRARARSPISPDERTSASRPTHRTRLDPHLSRKESSTMAPTPTREDKFSFGLWTVGWQARDLFGEATRPVLAAVEAVHKLTELGAYGITFHDDDLDPARQQPSAERQRIIDEFKQALAETGTGGADGHHQPVRRPGVQGRRLHQQRPLGPPLRAAQGDAQHGPRGRARRARSTSSGAAGRAPRSTSPRTSVPRCDRYREGIDLLAQYSIDKGYDMRFAIEPKPNEPRGDILLPSIGHALAFINAARAPRHGRHQPRDRARADGQPELHARHRAGAVGRASCSTSTSTARRGRATTRTWSSATATCCRPSPPSTCWRTARPAADPPTTATVTSTSSRCAPRTSTASGSRRWPTWSCTSR